MKVLTIIIGALLIIGGIYCFFAPAATYLALGPVLAVVMIVEGIGKIVVWWKLRKEGLATSWLLVSAILSIVFGCIVLGSVAASLAFDLLIAYLAAAWITVSGIANIPAALDIRKAKNAGQFVNKNWVWTLILGIIMIIVGVGGFFNPTYIALAIGLMIGISVIVSGVSILSLAFAA